MANGLFSNCFLFTNTILTPKSSWCLFFFLLLGTNTIIHLVHTLHISVYNLFFFFSYNLYIVKSATLTGSGLEGVSGHMTHRAPVLHYTGLQVTLTNWLLMQNLINIQLLWSVLRCVIKQNNHWDTAYSISEKNFSKPYICVATMWVQVHGTSGIPYERIISKTYMKI